MADAPNTGAPRDQLRMQDLTLLQPSATALRTNRIIGFDSRDVRARPFNLLRTSLAKKIKEHGTRLIGITSATPAAGKSFLSMNLAASLARVSEGPVYLVDLDLRRASVAEEIGYVAERGIESFLNGNCHCLADLGVAIDGTNLGLFPTVRKAANTAELLSGAAFGTMIDLFRNHSGDATVLFDLPPAFASDDTMIIVERLDGYVLLADSGKTTKKQLEHVVALLNPTPCLGTVLNRYRGGLGDDYGYGYGANAYSRYYG